MDTKALMKELLREIRGTRSQMGMSRRMGCTFNQSYRWESGRARMAWSDFAVYCRAGKVDLAKALTSSLRYSGPAGDGTALVRHLVEGRALNEAAKTFGLSRFKLQRWVRGESAVHLEGVLRILDAVQALLVFSEALVPLGRLRSLSALAEQRRVLSLLFSRYPAVGGSIEALDLRAYRRLARHKDAWLARRIGISDREEAEILELALKAGLIRWDGARYKKNKNNTSTRGHPDAERAMREYWISRGMQLSREQKTMGPHSFFGFLVFAMNEGQQRRLRESFIKFTNEMTTIIVEAPEDADRMGVINLQYFNPWLET